MKLKALIFDVDGTLADTERYGHLPASNDAMQQLKLNIKWDWEEFKEMIKTIPGNANRLKHHLEKQNVQEEEIEKIVAQFAPIKKQIYINNYLPDLKLREGILEIINEAVETKVRLAIVSTSYEAQINKLLNGKLNEFADKFEYVLGKESGRKANNNGFLYQKCLNLLALHPQEVIAIEDSEEGAAESVAAGIPTAVFYNDYTFGGSFQKARLVAPSIKYFTLDKLQRICLQ
jgi:beta-phosphoglucomutase-like phosphatase (HAD superfamily)